jgi:hypothetical protein
LTAKIITTLFAFLRLFESQITALFLDEGMNALYLPILSAYTILALGLTLMQGIESTLESSLIPLIFLMPLGYKIGIVL